MDFTGERYVPNKVFGEIEVEHKQRYHAILDLVKNKKVLDAACGEGYGTNLISQHAEFVWGIDISKDSIDWATTAYHSNNIEFKVSDIQTLPISDQSVDVVVSFETIEHVDEKAQEKFLNEIKRVLKPNGILIMSTPDKRLYSDIVGFTNEFHIKEFYENEFRSFLQSKFKHTYMFRQGFRTFSYLGACHPKEIQSSYYRMEDLYHTENKGKYLIALCSDKELTNTEQLNSIMPLAETKIMSKLILDKGNGFDYDNVITAELFVEGREFSITFKDLDKIDNIKRLKWIPLERHMININILDYPKNIQMISLNSFGHKESYTEFQVMSPEFLVEINEDTLKDLHIEGHIEILDTEEVFQRVYSRIEDMDSKIQDYEKLKEQLELVIIERDNIVSSNKSLIEENKLLLNSLLLKKSKTNRQIRNSVRRN